MTMPTEHKTVYAPILKYAQEVGWTFVPRDEAEACCVDLTEECSPTVGG